MNEAYLWTRALCSSVGVRISRKMMIAPALRKIHVSLVKIDAKTPAHRTSYTPMMILGKE